MNQPNQDPPSGGMEVPSLEGVVETALFVADTRRSERFYRDALGFRIE